MHFQEEAAEDPPRPIRFTPPQRPKLDPVDAVVEVENEAYRDNDVNEALDDVSFPASTFNHLSNNGNNDNFMSLYDTEMGPPKPPRGKDNSFMSDSGYGTASLF